MRTAVRQFGGVLAILICSTCVAVADEWDDANDYYLDTGGMVYSDAVSRWENSNTELNAFLTWRNYLAEAAYDAYTEDEISYQTYQTILSLDQDAVNRISHISQVLNADCVPPVWSCREKLDDAESDLSQAFQALYSNPPNLTLVVSKCDDCRDKCEDIHLAIDELDEEDFPYVDSKLLAIDALLMY